MATNDPAWQKAARLLVSQFKRDYRTQLVSGDPWQRAIHSMIQAWRIRASQQLQPRAKATPKCESWAEAAKQIKLSLDGRAKEQATKGT